MPYKASEIIELADSSSYFEAKEVGLGIYPTQKTELVPLF